MAIFLYINDLPPGRVFGDSVAIDSEAMGLQPNRDRLCVVQMSRGDGDCHMVHFPPTLDKLLDVYEAVARGDTRMQDFVVGFIDPNAPDVIKPPAPKSDDDDEVVDTGPDPKEVKARLRKIKRLFKRSLNYIDKLGVEDKKTVTIQAEIANQLLELKLSPKQIQFLGLLQTPITSLEHRIEELENG